MSLLETNLFIVGEKEADLRLDRLLAAHFPSHSRTYFQYLIENKCVFLNGRAVKKRIQPQIGDEVEIFFQYPPELSVEAENIPLDILYEDDYLLAINKPAGMVVHPAPGSPNQTFVNALLHHCSQLAPSEDLLRPGIVHRLDKDTSGVLLAAKTIKTHQRLIAQFANRLIEKKYLAICRGKPKNGTLTTNIERHPQKRKEMAVVEKGRIAISEFSVLAYNEKFSLVLIKPQTGRTHQIRVHLKYLKAPILGDDLYGNQEMNKKLKISRQLLHAYQLKFTHPITKAPMEIIAPIPDDLKKQMKLFKS